MINGILDLDDGECDLLVELVEEFAMNYKTDSPKLLDFINANEYKNIDSAAHKMKGAGANLGMKHFSKIAFIIEQQGKTMNPENTDDLLSELNNSFKLTMNYFKGFFSKRGFEFGF